MSGGRIAIVTGANRGLGYEASRQLGELGVDVVLTARDLGKAEEAATGLAAAGSVRPHQLDVTDPGSVAALADDLASELGGVDILVNNAGIVPDGWSQSVLDVDPQALRDGLETNVLGPLRMAQAVVPMMRDGGYGRIVNVSSGMGQLSEMNGRSPAYRTSKTSLNALTRILADELKDDPILVNSVCPGWVRTDLGGESAPLSVERGADTIVWLATLPNDGPTGGFFRERKPIAW